MTPLVQSIETALQPIDPRNKAMLASLHLKAFAARKHDRKASREVAAANDAGANAGRYNKQLIDVERYLKPISKLHHSMRDLHYHLTSPWLDNGGRILSIANFELYASQMNEYIEDHERLVGDFLRVYPQAKAEARQFLGRLYNEDDYPSMAAIEAKFHADYHLQPLPDVADFRMDLPAEELNKAATRIQDAYQNAMRDAWGRLLECVGHIANKLPAYERGEQKTFKDSLVNNLRDLVDVLPGLNLLDDPLLNDLAREARDKLAVHDAQSLREDDQARRAVASEAEAILQRMQFHLHTQ